MQNHTNIDTTIAALHESEDLARVQSKATFGALLFVFLFTSLGAGFAWAATLIFGISLPGATLVFASTQIVCAITFFGLFGVNYLGAIESRLRVLAISEATKHSANQQ
mgnify:CR=1 FL=1|jgi:hypothetical protein